MRYARAAVEAFGWSVLGIFGVYAFGVATNRWR